MNIQIGFKLKKHDSSYFTITVKNVVVLMPYYSRTHYGKGAPPNNFTFTWLFFTLYLNIESK